MEVLKFSKDNEMKLEHETESLCEHPIVQTKDIEGNGEIVK